VILLPLLASAGTALAVYSHTSPIVWIFQLSAKPGIGHTDRSYIPPPESVSLKKAGSLLKVSLVLIHGASPTHLRSVTFQGATTARKGLSAPSDKGSVVLVYSVAGQIISLREYHSSPGPLVSKLAGSNISPSGGQTISVITVDGGSYQIEQNSKGQVEFAEWKTLQGVLVVLNGLSPHSLSIDYVRDLLSHTK
jgi:hypothetical protein